VGSTKLEARSEKKLADWSRQRAESKAHGGEFKEQREGCPAHEHHVEQSKKLCAMRLTVSNRLALKKL